MRKSIKKLRLGRETLLDLNAGRLIRAEGGAITDLCTGGTCTCTCGNTTLCGTQQTQSKTPSCVPSGCTQEN